MKISIITVVYNNAKHVEDCIKSVLSQSYDDIEYIIVDGKSEDGTLEIVGRYKDKIARIVSEKDAGYVCAMNKGLSLATGKVVGFLHSDDFYSDKGVIERVANAFKTKNIESLYGDLAYVKKNNTAKVLRYWRGGEYNNYKFARGWMPPHPTFFVKRDIYEKFGRFNENFKIAADYEIMLRFLYVRKISTHYIPEVLVKMRWGGVSNRSIKDMIKKSSEDLRAWKINSDKSGFFVLLLKNIRKIPQFFVAKYQKV